MKSSILFLFLILSFPVLIMGQDGKVRVVDAKSREIISYAHVCFQELGTNKTHYEITNEEGIVFNPSAGNSVIAISFMGYQTFIDTIRQDKDYEFLLIPDVFDIDQAVVTASFVPQKADRSIYKVTVIDRRDIDERAAASIADILTNSLNIRLSHDPALGTGMRLKGLSGNNIKILVDGVPVIGRMGGNIDLSQLNLYNIDHIEMVEGPMSVVYGSNALAGAINIITKENKFTNFSSGINSYVENKGTYNFDGRVAFRIKNHSYSLSGARNFFNGHSLDTLRYQHWKPKEKYNADFYYTYSKNDTRLKFQSSLMKEKLWSKGNLIPPLYFKAIDDWFHSIRFNNRIEFDRELNNSYKLNIIGSHSLYKRSRDTYNKDLSTLSEILVEEDITAFNAFTYRMLFGNQDPEKLFSFISGLDVNYEIGTGERILNKRQEVGDYAFFTSLLLNVNGKLSLQPGFRFAHNTKFEVPPVPSLNIKWQAFPFLDIRASYARGYRAPTLKELYIYFVDVNHNIQPNENLKAEYGNNFDFTFSVNTDREGKTHITKIDGDLFYNNMNNIIVLAERSETDILYQYVNIYDYNTLGGQLSLKYSYYPIFDLEFGLGTTGTYFSLTEKKQNLGEYLFSPDANLSVSGLIPFLDLKISAFYKYTGETWFFRLEEEDEIEVSIMDSYNNLDITLMKKFLSNRLTVSAGVKNIFDNTIIRTSGNAGGGIHSGSGGSLIGYGRTFFARLSFNIYL